MEKNFFRSPILLLLFALIACACNRNEPVGKKVVADEVQKGWNLEQTAFKFQAQGKADSAFSYFSAARQHYEKAADSARIVYALLNMAAIQYQYNDFSEMQATMVEALKFLDQKSASSYRPIIYNNLGIAYCQLEDYPRAIENYQKTLALTDSPVHQLTVKNNIGYVYISSGKYQNAFDMLHRIYSSPNLNDSLAVKARVIDNLGYAAYRLGKQESVKFIGQGLEIRQRIGDEFGAITSNLHLGEALLQTDKYRAMAAVRQAERLAAKTNSPDDRLLALDFLARHSDAVQAKAYSLDYFRISDSLQTARRKARNHFAEIKYNYKRERDEKLRLQARQARLQLRESELENARLLWLIAAICILFLAFATIYVIVQRHKRNRWKAGYDAEVRIANRLHDELANDLHQAMVYTEANDFSRPENRDKLLDNLELIYRRARAISRENASVGDDDFVQKLKDVISYYGSPGQNVLAKGIGEVDWPALNEQQRVVIHRTVQEMLVNMKKHSQCTVAVLQFASGNGKFTMAYSDNGVGNIGSGKTNNGLSIMENRIRELKGTITFGDGGKGFRINIEFPI